MTYEYWNRFYRGSGNRLRPQRRITMTYKKDCRYILLEPYRCEFSFHAGKILKAGSIVVVKSRFSSEFVSMVVDVYDSFNTITNNVSVRKLKIKLEELPMSEPKSAYEQLLEKQKSMDEQVNALANDIRLLKKEFNDEDLRSLSMSDINIALTFIKFKDEKVPLAEKIKSIRSIISCLR